MPTGEQMHSRSMARSGVQDAYHRVYAKLERGSQRTPLLLALATTVFAEDGATTTPIQVRGNTRSRHKIEQVGGRKKRKT